MEKGYFGHRQFVDYVLALKVQSCVSLTVFMLLPVLGSYVIRLVCGVTAKWHLLLLWQCFSFVHGGLSECHDQPHLHAHVWGHYRASKPDKNQ